MSMSINQDFLYKFVENTILRGFDRPRKALGEETICKIMLESYTTKPPFPYWT